MNEELLYRAAIRNDIKGTVTYYRGTLANVLRVLSRHHGGIMDLTSDDQVYMVPATHRLPWEIPDEERTDRNILPEPEVIHDY